MFRPYMWAIFRLRSNFSGDAIQDVWGVFWRVLGVLEVDYGDRGKVLCYKSEGRWFDPSWCHWNFSLT